ncbi:tripeptidyl-peptidase 1 [Pyrenophora seminiperda CCB06]|uniref:tripeptidyl-peptidase II n=1 Tax=Pyrenophora seminiperda CCB06 TaxID=1302712 RepID=A0A3M7M5W6_9PLEO|nr:tripeptidyl-peptidase 1 [Pyrenophora seminiperda CCB06]
MGAYTVAFTGLLAVSGVGAMSTLTTSHIEGEVVERLNGVPEGWSEVGAPAPDHKLFFRIAVPSENRDLFERTLMEVSSPSHPRYGKHLKRDELKDLIKPRAESVATVLNWLEESGVEARDIHNNGEWINFYAPVKRAEEMMETTFKTYQSEVRANVRKIRSLGYSVPGHVRPAIDMIQPTTRFGQIRAEGSMILSQEETPFSVLAVNASCKTRITPTCLADLYNFKDFNASTAVKTKLGVTGYLEQYARFADLTKFLGTFAPSKAGTSFDVASINNGPFDQNSTADSVEANLDIQYTVGLVAPSIKTTFYTTPGRGELVPDLDQPSQNNVQNEPYLDLFTYLLNLDDDKLPQVLTTSYGENEQSVPAAYAKKVCDMIGQLGTRGVSVIFSSGDEGTGSACQTNDGKNTTRFMPIFPAACPYVTSVGGTVGVAPERGVSFSSGGFSDLWPRPAYQDKAVGDYLKILGNRWEGLYNPNGRGFPDVAAQGQGFQVVDSGRVSSVAGTSASAPVFAAVVAMLNNARMAAGMPALGFMNPWIYEQGFKGMNDIVNGGSTGCTGRSIYSGLPAPAVPFASWNATTGWDPVTGYGTPDFEKLRSLSSMPQYGKRRVRRGSLHGDV